MAAGGVPVLMYYGFMRCESPLLIPVWASFALGGIDGVVGGGENMQFCFSLPVSSET